MNAGVMKSEEAVLAQAFRHCADALLVLDGGARVMAFNEAAQRLFGFEAAEVLGRTVHELEARGDLLPPGPRVEVAVGTIPHQGAEEPALVVSARAAGKGEVVLRSLHDLAELVDARSRSLLLHACHELLSPLNAVAGYCQLAEAEPLPAHVRDYLREMRRAAFDMENMVRRMAEYARLCRDSGEAELHPLPLWHWVAEVAASWVEAAAERGIEFSLSVPEGIWVLAEDRGLQQVLNNLLDNAVRFHPGGGWVRLEARTEGDRVEIAVCDDGPGVPEADRARVFLPFERAGHSEGLGLGLAICREWVGRMGGELGLVSPLAEGRGSRFWFTLAGAAPEKGEVSQGGALS